MLESQRIYIKIYSFSILNVPFIEGNKLLQKSSNVLSQCFNLMIKEAWFCNTFIASELFGGIPSINHMCLNTVQKKPLSHPSKNEEKVEHQKERKKKKYNEKWRHYSNLI